MAKKNIVKIGLILTLLFTGTSTTMAATDEEVITYGIKQPPTGS